MHFSSISLREKNSARQLSDYLGYNVKNVLDPVFLLSKEQWESMEEPLEINEKITFLIMDLLEAKIHWSYCVRQNQGIN